MMDRFSTTVAAMRYLMEQTAHGLIREVRDVNAVDHTARNLVDDDWIPDRPTHFTHVFLRGKWCKLRMPMAIMAHDKVTYHDGYFYVNGRAVI